jgi:hypothetical protein
MKARFINEANILKGPSQEEIMRAVENLRVEMEELDTHVETMLGMKDGINAIEDKAEKEDTKRWYVTTWRNVQLRRENIKAEINELIG